MATHSSVLAWRIPGMGEPGGLWGCTESDMTEATQQQPQQQYIVTTGIWIVKQSRHRTLSSSQDPSCCCLTATSTSLSPTVPPGPLAATHGHFNNVAQTESHIMQLTSLNWLFGWHSYLEIHPG